MVTSVCGGESPTGAFVANTVKPDVANGCTDFMFLSNSSLPGHYAVSTVQVKVKITLEEAMKA